MLMWDKLNGNANEIRTLQLQPTEKIVTFTQKPWGLRLLGRSGNHVASVFPLPRLIKADSCKLKEKKGRCGKNGVGASHEERFHTLGCWHGDEKILLPCGFWYSTINFVHFFCQLCLIYACPSRDGQSAEKFPNYISATTVCSRPPEPPLR